MEYQTFVMNTWNNYLCLHVTLTVVSICMECGRLNEVFTYSKNRSRNVYCVKQEKIIADFFLLTGCSKNVQMFWINTASSLTGLRWDWGFKIGNKNNSSGLEREFVYLYASSACRWETPTVGCTSTYQNLQAKADNILSSINKSWT